MSTFTQDNLRRDQRYYSTANSIDQVIYTPRLAKHTNNYQDIKPYGNYDNLYPQKIIEVANKSWALSTALATFKDFIIGNGLGKSDELIINSRTQTLFDLLTYVALDKSRLGFAIHVNYNALGKIIEMQHVDFDALRYNEDGLLVYNPDWSNRYATDNYKYEVIYNLFDPEKAIEQANEVGWENYTGQIFCWTGTNSIYPLATFDAALEAGQYQADEELFKLRNIQNGFALAGVFTYPKSAENQKENDGVIDSLRGDGSGANNSGRFTVLALPAGIEGTDKIVQFIPFERSNIDGLYTNQNKESREAIFSVFRQPAVLNAISESGMFNQQSLQDAFVFYNSIVEKDRKEVEKALNKIMSYSVWGNMNLEIQPKTLIKSVNNDTSGLDGEVDGLKQESQARLKGSVGGVQGILSIQDSVSRGVTDYEAGLATLMEIYGFEEEKARKILGEPIEKFNDNTEKVENGNNTINNS